MRRVGAVLMVCISASIAAGALPANAGAKSPARRMVHRINVVRALHGLPRVRFSRSLTHSSRRYARRLMRHGLFAHGPRISASHSFGALGEILELHPSYRPWVARTVDLWLNSPSHRSVLLSPIMRYVGAGRARGSFLGSRSTIWVAQFGRK
jgi:uncharacterized protein YkwD